MLQPLYFDGVIEDPQHPLNQALQENDVYDWAPLAPVRDLTTMSIPAANWPAGIYLFELTGAGQRTYQRLVRQ